jgi:NAD(P)-dependent dehydrogenase (short-subunit alcohol dehydrogenase family)
VKPLEGKVALVAGGTRGAGRGIAVELGAAGVT